MIPIEIVSHFISEKKYAKLEALRLYDKPPYISFKQFI